MSELLDTVCIDALRCPNDGLYHYVGSTQNPKMRFTMHWTDRFYNSGPKGDWLRQLDRAGLRPTMDRLALVPLLDRKEAETRWIRQLFAEGHPISNHPQIAWAHGGTKTRLKIDEAAEVLHCSSRQILRAIQQGDLKAKWPKYCWIINLVDLMAYHDSYPQADWTGSGRPKKPRPLRLAERLAALEARVAELEALLEAARPQQGEARCLIK